VSSTTAQHSYSIREASALTGLPASTLRYYESIGVIAPVGRGESSGHRVYDEHDLDQLMWVACLAATGMSVNDMRDYVANGRRGRAAAADQIRLLTEQATRLAAEAERITLRQEYVRLKLDYWRAAAAGDDERAALLSAQARTLAGRIKK
jgi:DNA-binding transcriptional MerR regulator